MRRAILAAVLVVAGAPLAWGYAPRRDDMPRVESLARELAQETARVEQSAQAGRRRDDARADRAFYAIRQLANEASSFARAVDRQAADPARTEDDFLRLQQTYVAAQGSLGDLRSARAVERDFHRASAVMDELSVYYASEPRRESVGRGRRWDGAMMTLPAGSIVPVRIGHELRSRDLEVGYEVAVELAADVRVDSRTVLPAGTPARMRVIDYDDADRLKGRERISFQLASIDLGGRTYDLDSRPVTFEAEGSKGRDAGTIAGSAVVGALIGAITGGGDDALKGGAIGAAAGTGLVLATKGHSVKLEPGAVIDFELQSSARIPGGERRRDRNGRDISRY